MAKKDETQELTYEELTSADLPRPGGRRRNTDGAQAVTDREHDVALKDLFARMKAAASADYGGGDGEALLRARDLAALVQIAMDQKGINLLEAITVMVVAMEASSYARCAETFHRLIRDGEAHVADTERLMLGVYGLSGLSEKPGH